MSAVPMVFSCGNSPNAVGMTDFVSRDFNPGNNKNSILTRYPLKKKAAPEGSFFC